MKTGQWLAIGALGLGAGFLLLRSRTASADPGGVFEDPVEDPQGALEGPGYATSTVDVPAEGIGLGPLPTEERLESSLGVRDLLSKSDASTTSTKPVGSTDGGRVAMFRPEPRMKTAPESPCPDGYVYKGVNKLTKKPICEKALAFSLQDRITGVR